VTRGRLVLRGLSKTYDGVPAVDRVSLAVEPGEFVSLLGPSGCGKTTILRMIAGLLDVDAGDIVVDERALRPVPAWKRDLGMVFQHYALFPHMNVAQNVGFGLRMRGVPQADIDRRVATALALVKMEGLPDRRPSELSGGQQQRVALARALVTEPTVLLLDEPLGALDAKLRAAMQLELRDLQRRLGITTIFVTHDQEEAMTLSDRIAVMNQGRIEQVGTPMEIYHRPQTLFVAEFIGRMNRLPGAWLGSDRMSGRVRMAGVDDEVVVMVRPERLTLLPPGTPVDAGVNALDGRIVEAIFTGDRVSVFVDCDGQSLLVLLPNDAAVAGTAVGTATRVAWRAADTLVFPVTASR
jgi:putative spermidine/putrescine transport system ATP-binding protein